MPGGRRLHHVGALAPGLLVAEGDLAHRYLHDTSLWNASISANVNYRISRGLSIDIRSRYALIEDQLFISAAGLSEEDILLGRFSRPTDFEYSLRVGLTYEFGSIFNNVINPRFGN